MSAELLGWKFFIFKFAENCENSLLDLLIIHYLLKDYKFFFFDIFYKILIKFIRINFAMPFSDLG